MTDQLNSTSNCKACGGDGWVPINKDGRVLWDQCECMKAAARRARQTKLMEQSGLMGKLTEKSFENYVPKTIRQRKALEIVKRTESVFLVGPPGTGKTHLLAASVNEALKKGVCAVFFSAPWLMKMIREDMIDETDKKILDRCCEIEFLAIDDLGKEKMSETVQQALFMIVDQREIRKLRTSVTSNWMPDTLAKERLDSAIVDRLRGICAPAILDGKSYRGKGLGWDDD